MWLLGSEESSTVCSLSLDAPVYVSHVRFLTFPRHGRAHAVGAREVAAGGDHAPVAAADDHRDVAQFRAVAFLDGGVEGVAADMGDGVIEKLVVPRDARRVAGWAGPGVGRRPKVVHLGGPAIAVLRGLDRREDNPWVIAGRKPGSHLTDLQHPWRRIRARAGLDDVRIHDLRHSFASGGLLVGEGLPMIGKLLGHTQVQTTARYAHLANDPLKAAANRIASRIASVAG